jgi:hypothetical protein
MKDAIDTTLVSLIEPYRRFWSEQKKIYDKNDLTFPFVKPESLTLLRPTGEQIIRLKRIVGQPDRQVANTIQEIFENELSTMQEREVSRDSAMSKLCFKPVNKIPVEDCDDARRLYFSIPVLRSGKVTWNEFVWLYQQGYIPHSYSTKDGPKFGPRTWFIVDLMIRHAREKTGLGLFNKFADWRPNSWLIRQYIDLIEYMYQSWKLGEAVLARADKEARKTGYKGKEFRDILKRITNNLWINEGKILAQEIVEKSNLVHKGINLIEYYRDQFALLSFEAYPVSHMVDIYHVPSLRGVMMDFEHRTKISSHNMGIANVNTYNDDNLSGAYRLLVSASDWALSMSEARKSVRVWDIAQRYGNDRSADKNGIPCRVCQKMFIPTRPKMQVTCGNPACVKENRNESKRIDKSSKSLFV